MLIFLVMPIFLDEPYFGSPYFGRTHRSAPLYHMQWFKTMTTNHYIYVKTLDWKPFDGKSCINEIITNTSFVNENDYKPHCGIHYKQPKKWNNDKLK